VDSARVAFVLEVVGPETGPRTLDIVFAATESAPSAPPEGREQGMEPLFVPAGRLNELDLRPPLTGHLRGMLGHGRERYAPYLANLWRPDGRAPGPGEPAGAADKGSTHDDPATPHR
jgi:8-oxo-dGTP diphosphatase